jgi:hypothetical protein
LLMNVMRLYMGFMDLMGSNGITGPLKYEFI